VIYANNSSTTGSASSAVAGEIIGDATGHGIQGAVGALASSTGTGSAGYFIAGLNGTRLAAIQAIAQGANTTWAGYFAGNVFTTGTYTPSDERLKPGAEPVDMKAAGGLLASMNVMSYQKIVAPEETLRIMSENNPDGNKLPSISSVRKAAIEDASKRLPECGLFAQQVQKHMPELVGTDHNGYLFVDNTSVLYALVAALRAKVEELETKIAVKS
jgi:hypothetical protein